MACRNVFMCFVRVVRGFHVYNGAVGSKGAAVKPRMRQNSGDKLERLWHCAAVACRGNYVTTVFES